MLITLEPHGIFYQILHMYLIAQTFVEHYNHYASLFVRWQLAKIDSHNSLNTWYILIKICIPTLSNNWHA